jgi:hypothetical protein
MGVVRADKLREVKAGHDGTWAAHPGLISLVAQVFDENLPKGKPNQIAREDPATAVAEHDLLEAPRGARSLDGLRLNTRVGIQYIAAWLSGTGSVPLYNLMEDAATAEISRVQNWQWIRYEAELDGEAVPLKVTKQLFAKVKILCLFVCLKDPFSGSCKPWYSSRGLRVYRLLIVREADFACEFFCFSFFSIERFVLVLMGCTLQIEPAFSDYKLFTLLMLLSFIHLCVNLELLNFMLLCMNLEYLLNNILRD